MGGHVAVTETSAVATRLSAWSKASEMASKKPGSSWPVCCGIMPRGTMGLDGSFRWSAIHQIVPANFGLV